MNMPPQGMGSGAPGMGSGGQGMSSGPGGPRTMGSGSLGRGAMNNSLMPGGGGMGVRAYCPNTTVLPLPCPQPQLIRSSYDFFANVFRANSSGGL